MCNPWEEMNVRVSILIWKGNAYIPTMAPYEYGAWIQKDPVIISKPKMETLNPAIEEIIKCNLNQPMVMGDEIENRADPILKATKARSWYKLAETGASYLIDWTDDLITVNMTLPGKKNKFLIDSDKTREFQSDTKLDDILEVILADIESRPEALTP